MQLRQVWIDTSPIRSATATKCILQTALVLLILSSAIDTKQLVELAASTAIDMGPVDRLIVALLLFVAVCCGIGIIGVWRNRNVDVDRRNRLLVKIAMSSALRRHQRLSFGYKLHSSKIGARKQRNRFDGWLFNMNAASVLTGAATTASSETYFILLGVSVLLFIRASWWLDQVDHVYVRYIVRHFLFQALDKDDKRDRELDKDTIHLHVLSLSQRLLDEMVHRGRKRILQRVSEQQLIKATKSSLRKVTHRVGEGRSNFHFRLPIIALFFIIFVPGVSAVVPYRLNCSNFAPVIGAAAVACYGSQPQKKKKPLTEDKVDAFWYAINRYAEDKTMKKAKVIKELENKFKQTGRCFNSWFSDAVTTTWDRDVIEQLLSRHQTWSPEWHAAVKSIADSEFGPPVAQIYGYFDAHQPTIPPYTSVSPVSTDSSSVFSDSEGDDDEMVQYLFSDGGDLRPKVASTIISNLSRDTQLSVSEKKLHEAVFGESLDMDIYDETESIPLQIVDSIKQCLSHHTASTGTRPKESENLVKHLVLGCVFKMDDTVTANRIKNVLGTTHQQVQNAIETARSLRERNEQVQPYTRARRKDYIRDSLAPFIFKFCQDDRFSRLDTNQKPTQQVNPLLDNDEKVDVTSRIWLIPTLQDRYNCFLESEYYDDFVSEYARSVGFIVFTEVLGKVGKFVSNPTQRSCVDDVISNLEWAMMALKKILNLEQIQEKLGSFSTNQGELTFTELMDALKAGRYSHMVRSVCCDENVYEDLPKNERGEYLKLTRFECAHGECPNCGVSNKLEGILKQLEDMEESPETVAVMKWEKAPRQGTNDKGEQNSQLELTSRQMTIGNFLHHFKDCLRECTSHYHNIKWTEWAKNHDINSLDVDEGIMLTDFGATTNLKATEKVNSATDAHLVSCNAVVLTNRRIVRVEKPLGNGEFDYEDVVVFDVCYFHFLAETLTKGKKADHAMHKVCLDKIIEIMKTKGITKIIYWTDNAPHQYKCRQTFFADASAVDRHGDGIKIVHRFAVVSQFKGPHDSAGKDVGHTLSRLEKKGIRSPTAYDAFKNLNDHLVTDSTRWDDFEANQDPRLKNKGIFGMNIRGVFFVGETSDEVSKRKEENPELAEFMLVCDRTHTISAREALYKTADIHEIRSVQTAPSEELPRQYPAIVSDLMCPCDKCLNDVENSECKYARWRNCRRVVIEADSASPEEVKQFLNRDVIVTFRSSKPNAHKLAKIVAYEERAKENDDKGSNWKFRVQIRDYDDDSAFEYYGDESACEDDESACEDDGSPREEYLHYDEVCWSMNRYDQYEASGSDESPSAWSKANPHFIPCTQCDEKAQKSCPNHMCNRCCEGMMGAIPCKLVTHNSSDNQASPTSNSNNRCTQCDEKSQKSCPNHMCKSCCEGMMGAIPCKLITHNRMEDTTTTAPNVESASESRVPLVDDSVNQASPTSNSNNRCTPCDDQSQKSCPNHVCKSCCPGESNPTAAATESSDESPSELQKQLASMNVGELKAKLRAAGLKVGGKKEVLIERIISNFNSTASQSNAPEKE